MFLCVLIADEILKHKSQLFPREIIMSPLIKPAPISMLIYTHIAIMHIAIMYNVTLTTYIMIVRTSLLHICIVINTNTVQRKILTGENFYEFPLSEILTNAPLSQVLY